MYKFFEKAVSAQFRVIRPTLCGNCVFLQNFHTRKSGEMTALYAVKLTRNGSNMRQDLHRITLPEHSYSYESLILLIASNLPCYLHFAFCLYVWFLSIYIYIYIFSKSSDPPLQPQHFRTSQADVLLKILTSSSLRRTACHISVKTF